MFGPHLMIDGSDCDTQKLADRGFIEQILNEFPDAIGMTKIGGPHVFDYQAPDPAYSGVSGIVIIAESHIAIHTFPVLNYFTADVFSCRDFDPEEAIEYITRAFDVKRMDRILLHRGISFRGPHHGSYRASESSLAPGVQETSNHQSQQTSDRDYASATWPRYGVTPDYGTYGESAIQHLPGSDSADVSRSMSPTSSDLIDIEPVVVNPNASISGLIDKMTYAGGQARALGRVLSSWERMVRDPEMSVVLALSVPLIAEGLREVLAYAVKHHFVTTVIISAEDLFADLYESLGYDQYIPRTGLQTLVPSYLGHQEALACFTKFVGGFDLDGCSNSSDLWQRLGGYLSTHAPRKGLLQTAAAAGVRIFTPDLGTSTFGAALLALRSRGLDVHVPLDPTEDVIALAHTLGSVPRLGIIRAGVGAADALVGQAREVAAALTDTTPMLCGSISLGPVAPQVQTDQHVAISAGADLILPLVVTGLAQRIPSPSPLRADRHTAPAHQSTTAAESKL